MFQELVKKILEFIGNFRIITAAFNTIHKAKSFSHISVRKTLLLFMTCFHYCFRCIMSLSIHIKRENGEHI